MKAVRCPSKVPKYIASSFQCSAALWTNPAYVQGPVQVIGADIYGLDRDGDGIGCEDGWTWAGSYGNWA